MDTPLALPAPRLHWRDYLELTKPRVVALMLFTTVVGMLLAIHGPVPWPVLVAAPLGIGLAAGAAAALNHLIDRHLDAQMARTRGRPLPRGALRAGQVLAFALLLGTSGIALLLAFTNALCAGLTLAAVLGYAVLYTRFLKRATPQNIVIGGAAGAAPPLLGWVAVSGRLEAPALLLFLIIFIWTPPHFWALAIHRREEYARAAIPMLPVTHGVAFTASRIVAYAGLLWAVSLLPWLIGASGPLYAAGAAVLGGRFFAHAWRLRRDERWAMPTFRCSISTLFGLFALLVADHYLRAATGAGL